MKKRETKVAKLGVASAPQGLLVVHPEERQLLMAFRCIPLGSETRGTILRFTDAVAERMRPCAPPRLSLVVNKGILNE